MCKRLIYLVSFVLVLGGSGNASAELVGHWKLDGNLDDSAGSANGIFTGGAPSYGAGMVSQGLVFDGVDDYLELPSTTNPTTYTIAAWVKLASANTTNIITRTSSSGPTTHWSHQLRIGSSGAFEHYTWDGSARTVTGTTAIEADTWYFVVSIATNNGDVRLYVNGQEEGAATTVGTLWGDGDRYHVGSNSGNAMGWLEGMVDDIRVYDEALTQEEIQQAMRSVPLGAASGPSPADDGADVPRDVVLSWTPGEFAPAINGHIVHLSENFNDVNDGIGGISQSADSYDAGRLKFGTTYYWRVDEVNAPPDSTVYPGEVWSFTVEPIGYPIDGGNIIATASSSGQANVGPDNTINGSGLDESDLHSTDDLGMWLSDSEPDGAWLQYEFDKIHKLHEMWVWNYNGLIESTFGFGLRDVTIEYSQDGVAYTTLGTTHEFAQASAPAGPYAHNTTVDFGGASAKFVKLTASANWGGPFGNLPSYGLSEARFFSIPLTAREPSPDSGTADVDVNVTLGWRASREASTHDMSLSADEQAVIDGTAPATTVGSASYSPSGPQALL